MRITQKDTQKTPGSANRHPKSVKKIKKSVEEPCKDPKLINSAEVMAIEKEITSNDLVPPSAELINGSLKTQPLEKRKQDGSEWKALKKIDYQRLETVLEEVQSSSEATSSRAENSETQQAPSEVGVPRPKKPWFYNLVSITERPESLSGDEQESDKEGKAIDKKEVTLKRQLNVERGDKNELGDATGEPVGESISKEMNGKFPQGKRSIILNGMMEILPIFSNDKFVCSRDAISIEECEELETSDKVLPMSGKSLFEGRMQKDARTIDDKPGSISIRKGFSNRLAEKLGDFKEMTERKFRYKLLTDKNIIEQSSSHFINFLLVLTPFAGERKRLIAEKKMTESSRDSTAVDERPSDKMLNVVYGMLLAVFGLISIILGIAWRSYEPPCFLDYILHFIPFLHHRRTFFQLFFDNLFKIIETVYGSVCKNFFLLNRDTFDGDILN